MTAFHITQERIDAYARSCGDFNPIHVDPEFAKTTPFGSTIAHGPISVARLVQQLEREVPGARLARLDIKYIGAVRSGDDLSCLVRPDGADGSVGRYLLECRNQRGETVTVATATVEGE